MNPNDPKEFQEPMVQGWVWLRGSRGRFERMYAMVKQRSLLFNTSTFMERSDPGVSEVFLEGAVARAVHSNAAMGEFEFEIVAGEQTIGVRVESEALMNNWVAWVNIASTEEAWRDTLSKMFVVEKEEEEGEEKGEDSVFGSSKIGVLRESGEWNEYSSNEQVMIEYMSRLIDTYLETVKKNIMDSLPKVESTAPSHLVHHSVPAQPDCRQRLQRPHREHLQQEPGAGTDGRRGTRGDEV